MNDAFGPVAGRLCGLAARLLGWRPDEFWQATPAELAMILAPEDGVLAPSFDRADLQRLMEQDHDR